MSFFKIFDVAGSSMSAQSVRLNTTASNLANANVVSSRPEDAYRSRQPVFQTLLTEATEDEGVAGVRVAAIVQSEAEPAKEYAPDHPLADGEGFVYRSNVSTVEEMANMISASRSYQNSVEVLNTAKQLLLATLRIGQQ
jgi:flagellar basal-body rod protein FlgC